MPDDSTRALRTGVESAVWSKLDLWVASVALGGNMTQDEVGEILAGSRDATPHEHDLLAACLNDCFVERGQDHPVPYWSDLRVA